MVNTRCPTSYRLAAPTITGDPSVGGELTVDTGAWSNATTLQPRWLLNGAAVPGATGLSYMPRARDWGDEISVDVTGSRSEQPSITVASNRMTVLSGLAPVAVGAPAISGSGTVASPLVVTNGAWTLSGLVYSYQWSDGSGEIPGATSYSRRATLVLTSASRYWRNATATRPEKRQPPSRARCRPCRGCPAGWPA
jgi:hypothetical protein